MSVARRVVTVDPAVSTSGVRWQDHQSFSLSGPLVTSTSPFYPPGSGRILAAAKIAITAPTSADTVDLRFLIATVQNNLDGSQSYATVAFIDWTVAVGKLRDALVFSAPPVIFTDLQALAVSLMNTPSDGSDLDVVVFFA